MRQRDEVRQPRQVPRHDRGRAEEGRREGEDRRDAGGRDRGRADRHRGEPEAAGGVRGEGEEEGGEVPGPDQADPDKAEGVGLPLRVRRDEHQQAAPQDRRARGRDHPGEAEDQRCLRTARRQLQRDAQQVLK